MSIGVNKSAKTCKRPFPLFTKSVRTMETPKVTQEKVFQAIWAILAVACLIAAIFYGARHHFFTAAISAIMALAFRAEDPDRKRK